jgi:hypothetical protein
MAEAAMGSGDPKHGCPVEVGARVRVVGTLCLTNTVGGTEAIRGAGMECVVTKAFWDHETGWRFWGSPLEAADLETLRERGTSAFTPDWYRANRPTDAAGLAIAEAAVAAFDPSKVYFSEHDIDRRARDLVTNL